MSKELIERLRSGEPYDSLVKESVADRIEELERELEREQMRLVACDVVAMSDTPSSAEAARQMHPDYESASCESVKRRVDECIALRQKNNALLADNERLREAGKRASTSLGAFVSDEGWSQADMDNMDNLDAVLAAIPAQSLARIRNQVREECEQAIRNAPDCGCGVPCDCFGRTDAIFAIRELKEAEE